MAWLTTMSSTLDDVMLTWLVGASPPRPIHRSSAAVCAARTLSTSTLSSTQSSSVTAGRNSTSVVFLLATRMASYQHLIAPVGCMFRMNSLDSQGCDELREGRGSHGLATYHRDTQGHGQALALCFRITCRGFRRRSPGAS